MRKMTFQRAKELHLIVLDNKTDFEPLIEDYHIRLNGNQAIKDYLNYYMGEDEAIMYLLANQFELIQVRDLNEDLLIHAPMILTVFTNRRLLIFKNIKNKNYYRSKNQIPGLERGYHLFDSCVMMSYKNVEHFYLERNTLNINQYSANINEKSDRLKIDLTIYDFCYKGIMKIIGNYM